MCTGCEYRRRVIVIMAQAGKEWAKKPTGPSIQDIFQRLMREAQERGDFDDGTVRPDT